MESIMCIQWKSNKLGCSYFNDTSLELFLIEDKYESKKLEYTSMLITQISPKLIILTDAESNILKELVNKEYSGEVKYIPAKDFSFEKGRLLMLNWYIQNIQQQGQKNNGPNEPESHEISMENCNIYFRDPDEGHKTHAYLQLEGLIQLDKSRHSVGCVGVIMKYLQKLEQEEIIETHLQPIVIKTFTSDDSMYVNSDTMKSLCIFDTETHPNMHQNIDKESLSLFGLLDKTKSTLGKILLREWVSRPSKNEDTIKYRHSVINLFLSSKENKEKMVELRSFLRHIKNVNRLVLKIRELKANSNDWQHLLKFAYFTICIFNVLNALNQKHQSLNIPFLKKIEDVSSKMDKMKELGSFIDNTIDFNSSKEEACIVVKEGVNDNLDSLRKKYEKLDNYLLQISKEISLDLPSEIGELLNVVYFPQLGHLITLPQFYLQNNGSKTTKSGSRFSESHISSVPLKDYYQRYLVGFSLQFTTSDNLYYKNEKTKELDETIGDIHAMIVDIEINTIQELSTTVLKSSQDLIEISNILSELDCLISLSLVASKFNYIQPIIKNDDTLSINKGRHPLQELCVDIFIPNDTEIDGGLGFPDKLNHSSPSTIYSSMANTKKGEANIVTQQNEPKNNSIQVVTGANFSGKSVYLKQIALIVYMAHIGSFVPAEKAIIGVTDKLFTKIQTSETVSKPQSAFAFDLQQLNSALNNATNHSLVIIDEFGKGTDSSDGAALFCSVLGYFLSLGRKCPKVVASTHFHDVISKDIISKKDGITFSQTEIICHTVDDNNRNEQIIGDEGEFRNKREKRNTRNEVVFLYRIVPGEKQSKSYGVWCASIAGLPTHIIERAMELSNLYAKNEPILLNNSAEEERLYNEIKCIQKKFLTNDINELNHFETINSIQSLIYRKTSYK